MSWLAPILNKRVQILKPTQRPNEDGGFDFGFGISVGEGFEFGPFSDLVPLLTIWMGIKPVTFKGSGAKYIRGEQVNENISHEFTARKMAVASLGKEFGLGFSISYKFMPDLMPLKSDYFLFLQRGSNVKGRLFRIHDVINNKEQNEYLNIGAEEIEERGTGYPV